MWQSIVAGALVSGLWSAAAVRSSAPPQQNDPSQPILIDDVLIYQGQLFYRGQAVSGAVDLEFRLYLDEESAMQLGPAILAEDWPVESGRVRVPLDFGDPTLIEEGAWLEVTADGSVLSPRQFIPPRGLALVPDDTDATKVEPDDALDVEEIDYESLRERIEALESQVDSRGDAGAGSAPGSGIGAPIPSRPRGPNAPHDPKSPHAPGDVNPPSDPGDGPVDLSIGPCDAWECIDTSIVWTGRRVGIGTSSPSGRFHVVGNVRLQGLPRHLGLKRIVVTTNNGDLKYRVFKGWESWEDRSNNVAFSNRFVGVNEASPTHRLTVKSGDTKTLRLIGPGSFGSGARFNFGDAERSFIDEDVDDTLRLHAGSGITITHSAATPSINWTLFVAGPAAKPGGGSWANSSDARLKKNITPLGDSLERLLALRGVTYEYIDPEKIGELPGARIGMIAQEVEQVFPDWVDETRSGYKSLTYRGFEALVVEALRELRAEKDSAIASLEEKVAARDSQITAQETEIADLRERLATLEAMVAQLAASSNN